MRFEPKRIAIGLVACGAINLQAASVESASSGSCASQFQNVAKAASAPRVQIGEALGAVLESTPPHEAITVSIVLQNSSRLKSVEIRKSPFGDQLPSVRLPVLDGDKLMTKEQLQAQGLVVQNAILTFQGDAAVTEGVAFGSKNDFHTLTLQAKATNESLKSAIGFLRAAALSGDLLVDVNFNFRNQ